MCYKDDKLVILPFCQRLEIGLGPAVELHRRERGLPQFVPFGELVQLKTFKYTSQDLKLRFTEVDLMGQPKPIQDMEPRSYFRLVFVNIPRIGDLVILMLILL